MRLLLDTHAALWWLAGSARLSARARTSIERAGPDAIVSAASVWEAAIKRAAGKLESPDLADAAAAAGLTFLPIDERHAKRAGTLPPIHRDPFDRMLVAQAMLEDLTLVTADPQIPKYDVTVLW